MAPGDDTSVEPGIKKCKYCKGNIDKVAVKCCVCGIYLHQSCALRITGLKVSSGSKSLVYCSTCEKNARDETSNIALEQKDQEIESLKLKLKEIQDASETLKSFVSNIVNKLESVESNLSSKIKIMQQKLQKCLPKKKSPK